MKVTVDERTFTKSSLDRLVSSMLVEDKWPGSQSYSYRTGENVLHLMIVDNTTNERSIRLAARLHDYLSKGRLFFDDKKIDQKKLSCSVLFQLVGLVSFDFFFSCLFFGPLCIFKIKQAVICMEFWHWRWSCQAYHMLPLIT